MENDLPEPPDYLFSVVVDPDKEQVYVHLDKEGLDEFIRNLTELRKALEIGKCEHDHYHTPEWAGWQLSSTMLDQEREMGCTQVNHVKVYAWTEEWKKKHNL